MTTLPDLARPRPGKVQIQPPDLATLPTPKGGEVEVRLCEEIKDPTSPPRLARSTTQTTATELLASLWTCDPCEILTAEADAGHLARRLRSLRPAWTAEAACVGMDIGLFFPAKGQSATKALEVCATCPAREPCLAEALADPSLDHGVRGGQTAGARRLTRIARQGKEPAA